jgi:hypothetical protein
MNKTGYEKLSDIMIFFSFKGGYSHERKQSKKKKYTSRKRNNIYESVGENQLIWFAWGGGGGGGGEEGGDC